MENTRQQRQRGSFFERRRGRRAPWRVKKMDFSELNFRQDFQLGHPDSRASCNELSAVWETGLLAGGFLPGRYPQERAEKP
jgi:hypothetical protein